MIIFKKNVVRQLLLSGVAITITGGAVWLSTGHDTIAALGVLVMIATLLIRFCPQIAVGLFVFPTCVVRERLKKDLEPAAGIAALIGFAVGLMVAICIITYVAHILLR